VARRGAEGVDRLCDAAEKISRRRASSKYNRKELAKEFERKQETAKNGDPAAAGWRRVAATTWWLSWRRHSVAAGTHTEAYATQKEHSQEWLCREREMIVGLGVDIAEVDRVRGAIERQGERFLKRLYTAKERTYCEKFKNKYERYAGRFAVKEATMKALGTGWSRGVRWVDIEVVREMSGKPTLELKGEARKIADKLGVKHIAVTITHTASQAMAMVVFEG